MFIRGFNHVHTTLTDGSLSLSQIVEFAKSKKYDFFILTEHAEYLNKKKYEKLVEECDKSNFTIIPGLEFSYNNYVHILGIGLTKHPGAQPLEKIVEKIHEQGGISVLAHPNACEKIPYNELKDIDGVEAWNSRYKAKYFPRGKSMQIISKFRKELSEKIKCFSGLDLHEKKDFVGLYMEINTEKNTQKSILESLKKGFFKNCNEWFCIGALEELNPIKKMIVLLGDLAYLTVLNFRILKKKILFK